MLSQVPASLRHLIVPAALVVALLLIAVIRAPMTFTYAGLAGAVGVAAPLILAAMALTPIAMAGRGGVDLSVGPAIGFINVTIVMWLPALGISSPLGVFGYAIGMGILWQALLATLIIWLLISTES